MCKYEMMKNGITSQEKAFFTVTAVKTSNLTFEIILLVVTTCKYPVNPVTNPDPVDRHNVMCENIWILGTFL
jgi:hypothetical protein